MCVCVVCIDLVFICFFVLEVSSHFVVTQGGEQVMIALIQYYAKSSSDSGVNVNCSLC